MVVVRFDGAGPWCWLLGVVLVLVPVMGMGVQRDGCGDGAEIIESLWRWWWRWGWWW